MSVNCEKKKKSKKEREETWERTQNLGKAIIR
jgi:hypothetical protein